MDKPLRLYLLRHGVAEDESKDGADETRRLTEGGIKRTARAVKGLAKVIDAPDIILTSPLVRARQTADLAAERFSVKVEEVDILGRAAPQRIIAMLRKREEQTILAVGHEPTLSTIIEMLIAHAGDRGFIQLKKAGCAALDVPPRGHARLLWLATPKLLTAR